jgi:putative glutamine amidotransferase
MVPLVDDDRDTLRGIYDRLDGLLIPGGVDMDPGTFGEAIRPECGRIDPPRDRVELLLTRWAVEDHKPVLGLCRGLQVMNVALGGTLYQDLGSQRPGPITHDCFPSATHSRDFLAHDVVLADGSRLRAAFERPSIAVNSMHHQGIKDLASPLVASAIAPDGLVEGVESGNGHFFVGVQWHPEVFDPTDQRTRRLFSAFMTAAVEFARAPRAR